MRKWTSSNAHRGDKPATHVMLDGGSFHVPNEKYPEFVKVFCECLVKNDPVFVCENIAPTDVIRMYCDFDHFGPDPIDVETIEQWTRTTSEVIARIFGAPEDVRVAWVPSTEIVDASPEKRFKTGVHFVWTNVFVTPPEAASVASLIRDQFTAKFPGTDWSEVVDIGVYNSGLRMIGSRKVEWRSKLGDTKRRVRVDAGRAYVPVVRGRVRGGSLDIVKVREPNMPKWITATAIRTYAAVEKTVPKVPLPECNEARRARVTDSVTDQETINVVEKIIKTRMSSVWHAPIKSVDRADNGLVLVKTESMFCENVNREHNSCGVFLVISPTHIWQKCFCRCDTTRGRINGLCRDFASRKREVPANLSAKLFARDCLIEDDAGDETPETVTKSTKTSSRKAGKPKITSKPNYSSRSV